MDTNLVVVGRRYASPEINVVRDNKEVTTFTPSFVRFEPVLNIPRGMLLDPPRQQWLSYLTKMEPILLNTPHPFPYESDKPVPWKYCGEVNTPSQHTSEVTNVAEDMDQCIKRSPMKDKEEDKKWTLVFDGASNAFEHGVEVLLVSPQGSFIPIIVRLCFDNTNNVSEYEACALGLQAVIESKAKNLEVFGDSSLVIHQVKGEWETRDSKLVPYRDHMQRLSWNSRLSEKGVARARVAHLGSLGIPGQFSLERKDLAQARDSELLLGFLWDSR
ncbi:hypothetical protein Lal_00035565 [Lupinus albus]|nr:hypothetical protein Lal_00035565 [Lupinus albus]